MDSFNRGDYAEAYAGYSQLLVSFPKDPLYKYYSGVSLVMLEKDPSKAELLLSEALSGGSLKSLPADAIFYLGRALQMNGNFIDAEKSYRRYEQEAGRKKANEMNVQQYIIQCKAGQGQIINQESVATVSLAEKTQNEIVKDIPVPVPVEKKFVSDEDDIKLDNILEDQYKADSLQKSGKPVITKPVTKPAETTTGSNAAIPESPSALITPDTEVAKSLADSTAKAAEIILEPSKAEVIPEKPAEKTAPVRNAGTIKPVVDQPAQGSGVFSIFAIQETTQAKDVTVNPAIPEGLVYRIQIAVFKNPVSPSYFKGITPIEGFKTPGAAVTIYYAGLFRRAEDARKSLAAVKGKGFKDSFVAAMMDGKTISAERAAVNEKEWGTRPLYKFETEQSGTQLDTVAPTLHFRVEVARSQKPLAITDVDALKKLSGNRGLDVIQLNSGDIAYLIGNFITFESAEDYADLLQKNGYRESRVVAWLGRREIDVNTAKQLFENLQ
ncbi:MAG TPA: hypothetical protein VK213_02685 [Bacteroidales bacterium]|nr:hypothetical protein [Bacteroidales bacterium]